MASTTESRLTLLVGGARSGKSALAVELGRRHEGAVTYIATCPPADDDLRARIARHRAERPGWPTIEAPLELAEALGAVPAGEFVIIDCLTLWVSNLLARGDDDAAVDELAVSAADATARREGPAIVISNEVGLGVHPTTELGRRYGDVLGRVNQTWARQAGTTLLLVAGRAVRLDDPFDLLST